MAKNGSRWGFVVFIIILAALITAIFTAPLVFLWDSHVVGFPGSDALEHIWMTWWYDKAITTLAQSPAQMDQIIYYPITFQHPLLTAAPFSRISSLPFVHWFDPIVIYNVHIFLTYILTWLFMTLLCWELTDNRFAALLGGAIFAFFPGRNMHVINGHYTQAITYTYPLLVLALWRLWHQPTVRAGVAVAVTLILVATVDLMPAAYFAAPISAALLLFFLITDRHRLLAPQTLKSLGVGFGLAALALLPLFWPLITQAFSGTLDFYQAPGTTEYSADALAWFVPPPGHPLAHLWPALDSLSQRILSFGLSYSESVVYVGWITLVLATVGIIGMWRRRPDVGLWLSVAVITAVFAMGPVLRVAGEDLSFPLPYALLQSVPLLSWGRTPARLSFTTMFALSILAAYGAAWLLQKRAERWQFAATLCLLSLILLDSIFLFPWPMGNVIVPPFYRQLAEVPRPVAILDIPTARHTPHKYYLLYQMTHGHALVGGHIYRRPAAAEEKMAEFEALARPGGDPAQLAQNGVGYIILHQRFLNNEDARTITNFLTTEIGPPIYQDQSIIAFEVPKANESAPTPLPATSTAPTR